MTVYYKKLRAKEAAGRDGAMTRSVQGCYGEFLTLHSLVLNLSWSVQRAVPVSGLSFLFYIETIVCLYDWLRHSSSSNYQVTSADGGEQTLSAPAETNKEPCRDVGSARAEFLSWRLG